MPFLRIAGDGKEHRFRDALEKLASEFGLTPEERNEVLPSGASPVFDNRVGWARTYLKQAGLLESPKRGVFRITERRRPLLASNPKRVGVSNLEQFPEFQEFLERRKEGNDEPTRRPPAERDPAGGLTPEEQLASAYQRLRNNLEFDLLEQVKKCSPAFFERLVIHLLVAMGYGGSRQDAARAVGKSGNGGIDGIINEDRLGLDVIYVQAKRWEGTVSRPEVQKFVGALQGHRANKGVFITTSSFTREASA